MDDATQLEQLFDAVEAGNLPKVQSMVAANTSWLTRASSDGDQALHLACWQKHLHIVCFLIGHGAPLNTPGDLGKTPLHYALYEGDTSSLPIVRELLSAGADVNRVDSFGRTPLDFALIEATDKLLDCISLLRENGARQSIEAALDAFGVAPDVQFKSFALMSKDELDRFVSLATSAAMPHLVQWLRDRWNESHPDSAP